MQRWNVSFGVEQIIPQYYCILYYCILLYRTILWPVAVPVLARYKRHERQDYRQDYRQDLEVTVTQSQ